MQLATLENTFAHELEGLGVPWRPVASPEPQLVLHNEALAAELGLELDLDVFAGRAVPEVPQPVTDNSVKVRQLSHYQFSWIAGEPGKPGTYTLQLVLDQGAWEEVLTLDPDDADNLQDLLTNTETVHYDIERRVLMFGVTRTGS